MCEPQSSFYPRARSIQVSLDRFPAPADVRQHGHRLRRWRTLCSFCLLQGSSCRYEDCPDGSYRTSPIVFSAPGFAFLICFSLLNPSPDSRSLACAVSRLQRGFRHHFRERAGEPECKAQCHLLAFALLLSLVFSAAVS